MPIPGLEQQFLPELGLTLLSACVIRANQGSFSGPSQPIAGLSIWAEVHRTSPQGPALKLIIPLLWINKAHASCRPELQSCTLTGIDFVICLGLSLPIYQMTMLWDSSLSLCDLVKTKWIFFFNSSLTQYLGCTRTSYPTLPGKWCLSFSG